MKIGDIINYNNIEYKINFIDNDIIHLIDINNNGISILITELNK